MRIVADTNVLISATFWSGDSEKIMLKAEDKKAELILSKEIIMEYCKVMEAHEIQDKINADKTSTLVTLFSSKERFEQKEKIILTERQKQILSYLSKEGTITTGICAKLFNTSNDTALRELTRLKALKLIKEEGRGRGVYYVVE